ncbi:MAG: hypothetical protein ABI446_03590 [Gemmatimonadaceae bacterium]
MTSLDIRRWNVAHLVGASAAYWLGLAAATLTPFARAAMLDVALWIAVPPLALWLLWLAFRPSRDSAVAMHATPPSSVLPDPARNGFTERVAKMRSPLPADHRQHRS